jgi:hypothetical protein
MVKGGDKQRDVCQYKRHVLFATYECSLSLCLSSHLLSPPPRMPFNHSSPQLSHPSNKHKYFASMKKSLIIQLKLFFFIPHDFSQNFIFPSFRVFFM